MGNREPLIYFINTTPGCRRGFFGKFAQLEKSGFRDLPVGLEWIGLSPILAPKESNVITTGSGVIPINAEQFKITVANDTGLFAQLLGSRCLLGFASLNPTTRQIPARNISMPDQQDSLLVILYKNPHAQRHGTP